MARAKADALRPIDTIIPLLLRIIKQTYEEVCCAGHFNDLTLRSYAA